MYKYILSIILFLSGVYLAYYASTKKFEKINSFDGIKFLGSSWVGQGDGRYYSYDYLMKEKGITSVISSRNEIKFPLYVYSVDPNIFFKKKYSFDRLYFVADTPIIWRSSRIIIGIVVAITGIVLFFIKRPN